jgi:hypothetical protein
MTSTIPELVPVLSRGKHRSPRSGACFMEMASFLAGERWSDHPKCTHPLVASLARLVNDSTPDDDRQELVTMIPSVVGLGSNDPRWYPVIARRAAVAALPIVAEAHQRSLAVGLLVSEQVLAELEGRPTTPRSAIAIEALDSVPLARGWAEKFTHGHRVSFGGFRRRSAPTIVRISVLGIAEACVPDTPAIMRRLLADVVAECEALRLHWGERQDGEVGCGRTPPSRLEADEPAADRHRLPLRRDVPVGVSGVEVDP